MCGGAFFSVGSVNDRLGAAISEVGRKEGEQTVIRILWNSANEYPSLALLCDDFLRSIGGRWCAALAVARRLPWLPVVPRESLPAFTRYARACGPASILLLVLEESKLGMKLGHALPLSSNEPSIEPAVLLGTESGSLSALIMISMINSSL